jgi:hypothetical protein
VIAIALSRDKRRRARIGGAEGIYITLTAWGIEAHDVDLIPHAAAVATVSRVNFQQANVLVRSFRPSTLYLRLPRSS